MQANVYHHEIPRDHLPSEARDIEDFCKNYVHTLIGWETEGIDFSAEQESDQGPIRIVITVPLDRTDVLDRIAQGGLEPTHTEPAGPTADGDTVVIPRAFQVRHMGRSIAPQNICDNPAAMTALSDALAEHAGHLPPEALNCWAWTSSHSDPDTDILTISW